MKCLLSAVLIVATLTCAHAAERTTGAKEYLKRRFSDQRAVAHYDEKLAAVEPLENSVLQRLLPATSFYRSQLREFHGWAPSEIGVLVAHVRIGTKDDYRACLSPTFDEADPAFLTVFASAHAGSEFERIEIARAVTQLFASVIYKGRVGAVRRDGHIVKAELWHGHLMWRQVRVTFTAAQKIRRVQLVNLAEARRAW